jgi:hypothetical protein
MDENINKNNGFKDENQEFFIEPKKENLIPKEPESNNIINSNISSNSPILKQEAIQSEQLTNQNDNEILITETKDDTISKQIDQNSLETLLANV